MGASGPAARIARRAIQSRVAWRSSAARRRQRGAGRKRFSRTSNVGTRPVRARSSPSSTGGAVYSMVPACARRRPAMVSSTALRPAPSRPARPTISPGRTVQRDVAQAAAAQAGDPQHRVTVRDAGRVAVAAARSRPTISCTRRAASTSVAAAVATRRPSRSTVTRSASASTSSRRWLTYTTPAPAARAARTAANRRAASVGAEHRRRLVEQEDGIAGLETRATACKARATQRPRQLHLLALADRQIAAARRRRRGAADRRQRRRRALAHLLLTQPTEVPAQLGAEKDPLRRRAVRRQLRLLRHPADAHAGRQRQRPRLGAQRAGDHPQQRRLPRAVLADQRMHLAGREVEVDPVERRRAAEADGDAGGRTEKPSSHGETENAE